MELEFSRQIFEYIYEISWKSFQKGGGGVGVVPGGQDRWTDGGTDMTQLIDAFRNFAQAPRGTTQVSTYACLVHRKCLRQLRCHYVFLVHSVVFICDINKHGVTFHRWLCLYNLDGRTNFRGFLHTPWRFHAVVWIQGRHLRLAWVQRQF